MGQDKKQLTKLLAFVKGLYEDPDNKEFAAGIQSIVLNDLRTGDRREAWTKQINEIYELCLKKNLREQAEDLYKDVPLSGIAEDLVDLYVEMENARRANDFDSFGRYLFLQIELIVGTIIKEEGFKRLYEAIRKMKPLSRYNRETKTNYRADFIQNKTNRDGTKEKLTKDTVDKFLFISNDSCGKPIDSLGAIDKCRIVLYTVCYQAKVSGWPTEDFDALSGIYNVRNHESHTGVNMTDAQQEYYDRLVVDKTKNYLRFLGFLLTFIKGISDNYPLSDDIFNLAGITK
ncbi:MAG TPA: hypothetical protein PLF13_14240 [candidate division Zixibacteria bacterium]|nr:hypothetical protein [candidate division Zixibacteria bacterium]